MRIGIVGYGSFGKVLGMLLGQYAEVSVYEKNDQTAASIPSSITRAASVEELADNDVLFLAVDLENLESVCRKLRPHVSQETIVADVCSVKVKPSQILTHVLGGYCQLLATHPLFGPQTIRTLADTKNQQIVWHELTDGDFSELRGLFEREMGIEIMEHTPQEHDKEMAWVHGLTFFAGKALLAMGPPDSTMGTNYYQKLLDLVEVEKGHSDALFMTIQRGNPYTDDIRRQFLDQLQKLEDQIIE